MGARRESTCGEAVAWHPSGRRLATGCGGMICIINPVSGQVERKVEGCGGMAIAWLPSGWSLADCGDRLRLIDSVSGQVEREVQFPHPLRGVQSVAWHPDGSCLAIGCGDGKLRLIEAASGWVVCEAVRAPLYCGYIHDVSWRPRVRAADADGRTYCDMEDQIAAWMRVLCSTS